MCNTMKLHSTAERPVYPHFVGEDAFTSVAFCSTTHIEATLCQMYFEAANCQLSTRTADSSDDMPDTVTCGLYC